MVFEDERLSYGELDARSSQLAHHLRALGVGPEVVVGLCIERSLAMLVGLLGILKAGGAYLPLDPDYPPERLAFMLADAGAPVLLTRTALRAHLPAHDTSSDGVRIDAAHIVCLDADWPAIARQPTTAPVTGLAPQHPAYVIYTSGSTGTPKGVGDHAPRPRQSIIRADADRLSRCVPDDRRPLSHGVISFDAAVWRNLAAARLQAPALCITPSHLTCTSLEPVLAAIVTPAGRYDRAIRRPPCSPRCSRSANRTWGCGLQTHRSRWRGRVASSCCHAM